MRSKRVLRPFLRKQLQRVRHVWELARSGFRVKWRHWLQHPLVQARINTKVTGSTGEDRFQYFLRKYLTGRLPVKRALTLGCRSGESIAKFSKDQFERKLDLPHRAR
jgi:hypothetical protein